MAKFKFITILLFSLIVFQSCDNQVSYDVPDFELNLQVEKIFGSIHLSLIPVGDFDISSFKAFHNNSQLPVQRSFIEQRIYKVLYPVDSLLAGPNTIKLNYGKETAQFQYSYDELTDSYLLPSYADTVIEGNPFLKTGHPFTLEWDSEASPDFHILKLNYYYWNHPENQEPEMIQVDTTIFSNTNQADISAKFGRGYTVHLSLEACWGPYPDETGYTRQSPLPVNFRKCSVSRNSLSFISTSK